jgi:DNA-binding HxlR family transcriptional regulator/putative sterol carrier protein
MTTRSYNQYCGLAYALDKVGERWTLLIVRELIAGPRRFTDLMDGLCDISSNLLSERLKGLEEDGIVRRRALPPPAASVVYELTPTGHDLEKTLLELGKWGSQFMPPLDEDSQFLHLGSYALTPKTFFRAEEAQGIDESYELHIDNEILTFRIRNGELRVRQGEAADADVILYASMQDYMGLLGGALDASDAVAQGVIKVDGDMEALRHFLRLCRLPEKFGPA